jgi:hypothetical protein
MTAPTEAEIRAGVAYRIREGDRFGRPDEWAGYASALCGARRAVPLGARLARRGDPDMTVDPIITALRLAVIEALETRRRRATLRTNGASTAPHRRGDAQDDRSATPTVLGRGRADQSEDPLL